MATIQRIFYVLSFCTFVLCYFDYELYHNLTAERLGEAKKRTKVNTLAVRGFGRILTWNVKKLGACLRQDNVEQLKEVVCVILQSANLIILQEAENLDLSCLPCNTALKDEYEWPGGGSEEFKVLIKTRHSRSFSIKKLGKCDSSDQDLNTKSLLYPNDESENIYPAVMREYQIKAAEMSLLPNLKQHNVEKHHVATNHNNIQNPEINLLHNESNMLSNRHVLEQLKQKSLQKDSIKTSSQHISDTTFVKHILDATSNKYTSDATSNKHISDGSNKELVQELYKGLNKQQKQFLQNNQVSQKEKEKQLLNQIKEFLNEKNHEEINPNVKTLNEVIETNVKNNGVNLEKNRRKITLNVEKETDSQNYEREITAKKYDENAKSKQVKKVNEVKWKNESKLKTQNSKVLQNNEKELGETQKLKNTVSNYNLETDRIEAMATARENSKYVNHKHKRFHSLNDSLESLNQDTVVTGNSRFTPNLPTNKNDEFEKSMLNSDQVLSDRQIERFHQNDGLHRLSEKENLKNRLYQSKEDLEKKVNIEEQELVTERLHLDRDRLHHLPVSENKIERFRMIDNQLNKVEKEIDELENQSINTRFHSDNDEKQTTSEEPTRKMNINYDTSRKGLAASRYIEDDDDDDDRYDTPSSIKRRTASNPKSITFVDGSEVFTKKQQDSSFSDSRLNDEEIHGKSVSNPILVNADNAVINEKLLESLVSKHNFENKINNLSARKKSKVKRSIKHSSKNRKKHHSKKHLHPRKPTVANAVKRDFYPGQGKYVNTTSGIKRDFFSSQRQDITNEVKTDLNYVIMTIQSDLNSGDQFILVNVKLLKTKKFQRACVEKMISDISNVNSETEDKEKVLIMGDFHLDRLTGSDDKGDLYKMLNNLQIDGENYHSPITYGEKDPVTTVYGRRFDNIFSNINYRGNLKTIGPDFPLEPEAVVMPLTLQRLYNNYVTALYTTDNDESDYIYECIKAFQLAGKAELDNVVCKDSWVPSSYISDHLPLQFTVKMQVSGRPAPLEVKFASWNLQGDTFKERLLDPAVKKGFLAALKSYHVAVFHEFPPHDRILDDEELGSSDIVRLKQGELTTEFGIYISENVKDGETDMFVLRKKYKGQDNDNDEISEPTAEESKNMITTVGLFTPKIVVDTVKLKPCLYTVRTSSAQKSSEIDLTKIINAIDRDVQNRECDFKVLMASMNLDDTFDLDKEIYKKFKYINMKCQLFDGDNKYKYNIPRSRDLADYVIIMDKESKIEFDDCTIGLPGDETKRGIEKLSDFEELSTHYPLSIVVKIT